MNNENNFSMLTIIFVLSMWLSFLIGYVDIKRSINRVEHRCNYIQNKISQEQPDNFVARWYKSFVGFKR